MAERNNFMQPKEDSAVSDSMGGNQRMNQAAEDLVEYLGLPPAAKYDLIEAMFSDNDNKIVEEKKIKDNESL